MTVIWIFGRMLPDTPIFKINRKDTSGAATSLQSFVALPITEADWQSNFYDLQSLSSWATRISEAMAGHTTKIVPDFKNASAVNTRDIMNLLGGERVHLRVQFGEHSTRDLALIEKRESIIQTLEDKSFANASTASASAFLALSAYSKADPLKELPPKESLFAPYSNSSSSLTTPVPSFEGVSPLPKKEALKGVGTPPPLSMAATPFVLTADFGKTQSVLTVKGLYVWGSATYHLGG